jgi:hypothetical protein
MTTDIYLWDTSRSWFDLKNIVGHVFLSVEHYKFVNLSLRHRTVSSRQKTQKMSSRHCAVSHRQIHKFIVSHRQKYDKQYFSD